MSKGQERTASPGFKVRRIKIPTELKRAIAASFESGRREHDKKKERDPRPQKT